jgi:Na+/proline symporter
MKRLAEYSPVLLAILLAIALTAVLHSTGKGLVASALMGSAAAVLSVWFAFFSIYRLTMFVTRGAPFRVGDSVRVTDGDYAGMRGTVTKIVDGSPTVFLKLDEESSGSGERYFDWNQVSRRRVTNNGRTRRHS